MTADATGKSVCAGPSEATALGNALVQAISSGDIRDLDHLRSTVSQSFPVETCEPIGAPPAESYDRYVRLLDGACGDD
jgi:rhamnulokinase